MPLINVFLYVLHKENYGKFKEEGFFPSMKIKFLFWKLNQERRYCLVDMVWVLLSWTYYLDLGKIGILRLGLFYPVKGKTKNIFPTDAEKGD